MSYYKNERSDFRPVASRTGWCAVTFVLTSNRNRMNGGKNRIRAFSLPELLVVLVIIGILVLVALPNLMPLISRAKTVEAQQQLAYLHSLEKSYFYTYSKYSSSLDEIGFEQSVLVSDGGQANYVIEIVEATEHGFRATATSITDFDGDGVFNVWEIDERKELRETVKD